MSLWGGIGRAAVLTSYRFLEEGLKQENPGLHRETHFFNTFFYERLSMKGDKLRNMEGVSKWTAKIDLFEKKYIIVPINEWWGLSCSCPYF